MDIEKLAELLEIWSASSMMPGVWDRRTVEEMVHEVLVKQVDAIVEDDYVLVERDAST